MTSSIIIIILLGAAGASVVFLVWALKPKPTPLAQIIYRLQKAPTEDEADNPFAEIAKPLIGFKKILGQVGFLLLKKLVPKSVAPLQRKLFILGRSIERHSYEKMLGAFIGFFLPVFMWWILLIIGLNASIILFVVISLLLAALGYWYPDIPLNEQVEKRQRAFRYAFSSYLDLVTVMLAGGGGIETSLMVSAEAGAGWAFGLIRRTLLRARLSNQTPWAMFEDLGKRLEVSELNELAATISLAGQQGARIRDSLLAKADSLRSNQQAEIEREAESRSEKMTIPVLVMVVGLILFIGYGAVQAISVDSLPGIGG